MSDELPFGKASQHQTLYALGGHSALLKRLIQLAKEWWI